MNTLLLFVEILVAFGSVLLVNKIFKKEGLYVWIGLATVLANLQLAKCVDIFGINATLGNVMFASTFLATDIISECYGKKEAKKGVWIGLFCVVSFVIFSQITLAYTPNDLDFVNESMVNLFTIAPRICISSIIMYFIANYSDVLLYNFLKKVFKGKYVWVRNNVSTIVCNCLENFGLFILMFAGIFSFKDMMIMALATSLIEIVIAVCDTPFLYIAKKTTKNKQEVELVENKC